MQQAARAPAGEARSRLLRWILLGGLVVLAAVILLVWLVRRSLAEQMIENFCRERDLACEANVQKLGAASATLNGVRVKTGEETPFAAEAIKVNFRWQGLTPKVTRVAVTEPVVRARLDQGKVSLGGLEKLIPKGGTGGAPPQLDIPDARLILITEIGHIEASGRISGAFPQSGEAVLEIPALALSKGERHVRAPAGQLNVTAKDGVLSGAGAFAIDSVRLDGLAAEALKLEANFDAPSDGKGATRIAFTANAATALWQGVTAEGVSGSGDVRLARFPGERVPLRDVIESINVNGMAESFRRGEIEAGKMQGTATLQASESGLAGPVKLVATGLEVPQLQAGSAALDGTLRANADRTLAFEGAARIGSAALSANMRKSISAGTKLPEAFSDLDAALQAALPRGFSNFALWLDAGARIAGGKLELASKGPVTLKAASGLTAVLVPAETPALLFNGQGFSAAGNATLSGGGVPKVSLNRLALALPQDRLAFSAEALSIAPWRAGAQSLTADLQGVSFERQSDGLRMAAKGVAEISGKYAGTELAPTKIVLNIDATKTGKTWSILSGDKSCVDFASEGFVLGAITAGAFNTKACPSRGVFVKTGATAPEGQLALSGISIPITLKNGSGAFNLGGGTLDWSVRSGLSLVLRSDELALPLTLGARTLTLDGRAAEIKLDAGKGAPKIMARLGATDFSGTLIPAKVTAKAFGFDGESGRSGLAGTVSAGGVIIRDVLADPLYQPLTADFRGELTSNQLRMTGPLALLAEGRKVADAEIALDVARLDGKAMISTGPLTFAPRGLKPEMLSDRLRGVFSDASGVMSVKADFDIKGGALIATGDVDVTDFGFQTQRLGRVTDIDGSVRFTDLIKLTTAPAQKVTIGSLNPGLELTNGDIRFGLTGGKVVNISQVKFPFANGTLEILPFDWVIASRDQDIEATVNKLDLKTLVEFFHIPDTRATGTMSGRFPVAIRDQKVEIVDAVLTADASGGLIAYSGKALDPSAAQDPNSKLAFQALRDLEFRVLELGLSGDLAGTTDISLHFAGANRQSLELNKNATVAPGQPFDFNLSFEGSFDGLLNTFRPDKAIDYAVKSRAAEREKRAPQGE
jgi:hypothetical protein